MAGKSPGGGLLGRSIGIEPPRLLHGRAASYGSIINPVCCHRLNGSNPPFSGGFIARPDCSGVLAHLPVRLRLSACIQECTWWMCIRFSRCWEEILQPVLGFLGTCLLVLSGGSRWESPIRSHQAKIFSKNSSDIKKTTYFGKNRQYYIKDIVKTMKIMYNILIRMNNWNIFNCSSQMNVSKER